MTEPSDDNIQVAVRIRPLNDRERKQNAKSILTIDQLNPQKLWVDAKPEQKAFIFDNLIDPSVGQADIFELVGKPQAKFCLKGYNASIFAYGQTGAGKTFTMLGKGGDSRGLQPRVFEYIFEELTKFESSRVKCSYLEIYNEQIIDLLSVSGTTLMVREDTKKGVYIEGLSEEKVTNSEQAIELLNTGARNRHVSSTQMNFESSRSHSLFSLTIETKDKEENGEVEKLKCSKFHFVDLAGSERQNLTGAAGQTLKEASNINKSLTVLGCVINSLVEQSAGKARHIPYRDSKLTFILKDSLGGNSKTCIISAVSDASISFQETLSTLKFAQRAKMIKNKAQLNEENTVTDVRVLRLEIKQLREKIEQMKEHEALIERTAKETRSPRRADPQSGIDHSEELEALRAKFEIINAECQKNEQEFANGIDFLNAQHLNEVSKYESAIQELTKELSKQFKSDMQKEIILNSQQIKLKQMLSCGSTEADSISVGSLLNEKQADQVLEELDQHINNRIESEEGAEEKMDTEQTESEYKPSQDSFYLKSLNHLLKKINESVQSRQDLQQVLAKIGLPVEWESPEKMRFCEESIKSLREEYTNQLSNLQSQLHESREQRQSLTQELQKCTTLLQQSQSEMVAKEQEIKQMEQMYMDICSTMNEESEQKSTARILELEEKVIILTQESTMHKREHARVSEALVQLEQDQSNMLREYDTLSETFDVNEGKRAILESEMKVQVERIKELEAKELSQQSRITSLSNEVESFISQSAEMLEQANEFERIELANETLAANNGTLSATNERLSSENAKLTDQIEVLTTSNTFLQTRIDELQISVNASEKLTLDNQELVKKCNKINEQYEALQADLQNLHINSTENSEALVEQNKSLYRRIDEYVAEIDNLTKESNNLKVQVSRRQEQVTKLQQKSNEVAQSQKHFQTALKEAQDKLALAQQEIAAAKGKAKARKEQVKMVVELQAKLQAKEDEMIHIKSVLEERTTRCNDVCEKLNDLLDDKDRGSEIKSVKEAYARLQDTYEKLQETSNKQQEAHTKQSETCAKLQEVNSRLVDANSLLQKDKTLLQSKLTKAEQDTFEVSQKNKGLEETFNNLIVQYSLLKGEHNQLVLLSKHSVPSNTSSKGVSKLEAELQVKTEKINDLQNYLDKYALQIRQLDADNAKNIKELEIAKKNCTTYQATVADSEKRIDDLLEIIGEFEMQCGAANNLLESLQLENQENQLHLIQLRETQLAAAAAAQTRPQQPNQEEEIQKLTKKLKKYKVKLIMANTQIEKAGKSQEAAGEAAQLRTQLIEKEKVSKHFQDVGEELSLKLVQANKKIAQQTEHIQFQLKCYEEDKKHTRIEADRQIKTLQTSLEEKTRLLTAKTLRMNYFENLHAQIAESLDKNNLVYTQNQASMKERERKISYATKLQQEIHHQLSAILNRKSFFKGTDDPLRQALTRVVDFIDHRSLDTISASVSNSQSHTNSINTINQITSEISQLQNKENQQDINNHRIHSSARRDTSSSAVQSLSAIGTSLTALNHQLSQGLLKPAAIDPITSSSTSSTMGLMGASSKPSHSSSSSSSLLTHAYSNLNVSSAVIAKDIEEFDRKLEQQMKISNQNPSTSLTEQEPQNTSAFTSISSIFTAPTQTIHGIKGLKRAPLQSTSLTTAIPAGSSSSSSTLPTSGLQSSSSLFNSDLLNSTSKSTQAILQQYESSKKQAKQSGQPHAVIHPRIESSHGKNIHRYLDESIASIFADPAATATAQAHLQFSQRRENNDGDLLRKKIKPNN